MASLLVVTAVVFTFRSAKAAIKEPLASRNIQQQQYQMARFLRDYYDGQVVGINDVGAISFFARTKFIDLWGLASTEVAKAILNHTYNTDEIERIAHKEGMQIAVVYTDCFRVFYGGLPKSWVPVGTWTIPDNYVCGDSTVTFFAIDPRQVTALRKDLVEFGPRLPEDVRFELFPQTPPPQVGGAAAAANSK